MTIPQGPSALTGASPLAQAGASPQQQELQQAGFVKPIPLNETIQMTRPETRSDPGAAFGAPAPTYPGGGSPQAYGSAPQAASAPAPAPAAALAPQTRPDGSPVPPQPGSAWGAVAPTAVGLSALSGHDGSIGRPGGVSPTPTGPSPTITGPASAPTPTGMQGGPGPTVIESAPVSEAWNSQRYSSQSPPPGLAPYRIDAGPGSLPLPPPRPGSGPYAQPTMQEPLSMRYGAGGAPSSGQYGSISGVRPAKGGIVFVIIGMSVVIAVLLMIILWAVLR